MNSKLHTSELSDLVDGLLKYQNSLDFKIQILLEAQDGMSKT